MSDDLREAALRAFRAWAPDWVKHTRCHWCSEHRYCRARQKGRRWVCLDCFDQGKR